MIFGRKTFPGSAEKAGAGVSGAGFTLVELLVAMVVLAIGIMATMTMQYSSLAGAMISRDNSNAADVAHRVMEIMQVESQQWRSLVDVSSVAPAFDGQGEAYRASPNDAFLKTAAETNWTGWASLFSKAVDARLTPGPAARYCVYVRGGYLDATVPDLLVVHVAVVFPSANQIFADNNCLAVGSIVDGLDPSLSPDDANSIQMSGYRVQYFGTQIARKDYLDLPPLAGSSGP